MNDTFNRASYFEARKPVVKKYRKFIPVVKKNLNPLMELENSCTQECQKVYLRIKPYNTSTKSIFTVDNSSTLTAHLSKDSTFKNTSRNGNLINHQFKFSKIFDPNTTQKQLFRETCLEPLQKFISGEDCLLFAYGATNAGKTFTIQGSIQQPGIIPQALNMVFSTLKGRLRNDCRFKPYLVKSVEELDDLAQAEEFNFREKILGNTVNILTNVETLPMNRLKTDKIFSSPSFQAMKSHLEEVIVNLDHEKTVEYYLWVSFFEIHNECIYDLLEQCEVDGKRKNLSLVSAEGGSYVKDIKQVCVTSADEAFQVYMFGRNNLKTAFTNLNSVSSRSHSIFSLKMICLDSSNKTVIPRVGVFSCVDLAGAERAKKTNNQGLRLKESQNINSSLLVLGRCLTAIRHNQTSRDKMVVPYRDSKLTRVFQHALTGQQCVTMIVNVNFDPKMNKESLNALKFSAIAREIVVAPIKIEVDTTFRQQRPNTCCEHLKEISDLKCLLEVERKNSKHLEDELSNRLHQEIAVSDSMSEVKQLEIYKNFYRTSAINMEMEVKKLKSQMSQLIMKEKEVSRENSELKVEVAALNRKLGVSEVISSTSNENPDCLENKLKELLSELEDKDKKIELMSKELEGVQASYSSLKNNNVILENELETMDKVVRESCDIFIESEDSDSESSVSYESEDEDSGENDTSTVADSADEIVEVIDLDDSS